MTANEGLYTNNVYHHQTLPVPNQTQKANEGQRLPTTVNVGTTANEGPRFQLPAVYDAYSFFSSTPGLFWHPHTQKRVYEQLYTRFFLSLFLI